jgi:hypothetical protein
MKRIAQIKNLLEKSQSVSNMIAGDFFSSEQNEIPENFDPNEFSEEELNQPLTDEELEEIFQSGLQDLSIQKDLAQGPPEEEARKVEELYKASKNLA